MTSFQVLNRDQNVHRNYFLEASAGTGKTFSIENVVVRLLIEGRGIPIENILVVTFTKMATRDLKIRIRSNIEKALRFLKGHHNDVIDYLQAIKEAGCAEEAIDRLETALMSYDQAQIFTIHGFCARMLAHYRVEAGISGELVENRDEQFEKIFKDFVRTELTDYSPSQLKILLKNDLEQFKNELLRLLAMGLPIEVPTALRSQFADFQKEMHTLKYSPRHIIEDFIKCAPSYKNICDSSKRVKIENLQKIERFAGLFELDDWSMHHFDLLLEDGLYICEALDPKQLKAKATQPDGLHYPGLIKELESLSKIIQKASSPLRLLAKAAYHLKKFAGTICDEKELFGFDDLLKTFSRALQNPLLVKQVQTTYQAAIVDEFQDTDPLQWGIFKTLFLGDYKGYFYLVGDPKQSIYAFRQADIYTYLEAGQAMGAHSHASLSTNYRSQPSLISALNTLFNVPKFISLPRLKLSLPYQIVESSKYIETDFRDNKKNLHVCLLETDEETSLLAYLVNEMIALHYHLEWKQFAILVSDRFQADRVGDYLKSCGIPCLKQRSGNLLESEAGLRMQELLDAIVHSTDEGKFKVVLGGKLIQWNNLDFIQLNDSSILERLRFQWSELADQLRHGFAAFFQKFLESTWNKSQTVLESILQLENGDELYNDLMQFFSILIEYERAESASPAALLNYLDRLLDKKEASYKKFPLAYHDAVQILTIHASKGLEFGVVFPIGLLSRTRVPEQLLPVGNPPVLTVVEKDSEAYLHYCEELDAEKMRQLYVALTRAKYRLYVPVILNLADTPSLGTASPMELFVNIIGGVDKFKNSSEISCELISKQNVPQRINLEEATQLISPKLMRSLPETHQPIFSFSSLSKQAYEEELAIAPHDFSVQQKTPHTLPAGRDTGVLLHTILEKIPFGQSLNENEIRQFIEPLLSERFLEWSQVIAKMIFRVLTIPLDGESLILNQVPEISVFREMEFLYSSNSPEGLMKGFVDLICHYQGKYYLIDWKSNWLGDSFEAYSTIRMEQEIKSGNYDLQAKIYMEALQKYLRLYQQEKCIAGCYFVFLRGARVVSY